MNAIDRCFATFKRIAPEIRTSLSDDSNEAACRFRAIDRILTDVLEWKREEVFPEEYTAEGRIDYLFKSDGVARMVIEAKSLDTMWFDGPHKAGSAFRLNGPVFSNECLKSVLIQSASYSAAKNVALTVATNGLDWVIFLGNRIDGIGVFDGMGFLFQSLDQIETRFELFFSLLHRTAVLQRKFVGLFEDLERGSLEGFSFNRAVVPKDRVALLPASDHSVDVAAVCREVFRDLVGRDEDQLLQNCFVETRESEDAERRLERITRTLTTSIQSLGNSTEALSRTVETAMSRGGGEQVLIIGVKGAGKSTFVSRFFARILDRGIRDKCIVLRVDLSAFTGDEQTVQAWLTQSLIRVIDDSLRNRGEESFEHWKGIFHSKYERLRKTTFAALYEHSKEEFDIEFGKRIEDERKETPFEYAVCCIGAIARNRQLLPVIIFDNADHFSSRIQDETFQFAAAISKHADVAKSLTIVPVTERTLWSSKDNAFASHFATRFYLPPPTPRQVISKRLAYIADVLKHEPKSSGSHAFGRSMRLSFNDLYKTVLCLQRAISEHRTLSGNITLLANGNVRTSFQIFERIATSGHLRLSDLIGASVGGQISADLDLRLRKSLLRGDYGHFHATSSEHIVNLFDLDVESRVSPLLGIRMLAFLRNSYVTAKSQKRSEYADVEIGELSDYFANMDVKRETILAVLNELLARQLIETDDPTATRIDGATTVCMLPRGLQHLRWVRGECLYLDTMALVTEIHDEEIYAELVRLSTAQSKHYFEIRKIFVEYCVTLDSKLVRVPDASRYRDQTLVPELLLKWTKSNRSRYSKA